MNEQELTNKQLVEKLQELGVDNINPQANKTQLKEMLDKAMAEKGPADNTQMTDDGTKSTLEQGSDSTPTTNMDKIMSALSGIATSVDTLNKRVTKIETGDKDAFMNEMKQEDVDSAAESKSKADPRVVAIVEEVLGVDFGVQIDPNPNSPGFQFTVLVPQRLSPIPGSTRPVVDKDTGEYKKDEKTETVIEENYWPGDRRSRAIGSTDSFDIIRDHCNKVRAHIVTYYEKLKKPLPEFKLRG